MRWKTDRNQATQDSSSLSEATLSIDCLTRQNHPVHVKAVVSFRIDVGPAAAVKRARRTPREELSTQVHDIFARQLRSVVGTFAWDEMLRDRLQLTGRIAAAGEPEMTELGLRVDTVTVRALDFPYDSEPSVILRAADAKMKAREKAKAQEAAASATASDD